MLFNSYPFIFVFLPIALVVFYGLHRLPQIARIALTLLSLAFYGWWKATYLPLLIGSIVFNFLVGGQIQRAYAARRERAVSVWVTIGVGVDLGLLGWFKYANFFVDNINAVTGAGIQLWHIALPLAISFFTFQKIAYLIDSARGDARKMTFNEFALFASFFPQLIAGPIVHYKEIVPQIQGRLFGTLIWRNMMVGLVIFAIGLFKKVVIADTVSLYANPLYGAAHHGATPTLIGGWLAAATYTCQLYFDFSGYSDMAIGLGRMLGVKLPLNFHSPLRARNVAEYWRRWHMTLQRFILAYLFQPLALKLNRWAAMRGMKGWSAVWLAICFPTLVTFILVGAWHGAGWTFVVFGLLHGIYLSVIELDKERRAQLRRKLRKVGKKLPEPGRLSIASDHVLTIAAVMFANVVFRALTLSDAWRIWGGMVGFGGAAWSAPYLGWELFALLALCALIIALFPNTQQIMGRFDPAYNWDEWREVARPPLQWEWKPNFVGIMLAGLVLTLGIVTIARGEAVFLYFNF
jgi:D-alanyl-lipoteichoic acid acyltransferase DltB (MBOAT superfamily)